MAEVERGFLGLTHNPFVQPDQGFFEQADRKTHLEQLRHLSQWSQRVLLVTGPQGVGKSSLYRQLSANLEPRCKAARIHASLISTAREVLLSVAQGFGIAVPSNAGAAQLTEMITDHVDEQSAAERVCVIMVDDADMLEPKAVVELMTLAAQCKLQLVFFGESKLVPAVERTAGRLGLGWHEIRLSAFSEAQTREYLEWRFQQARYRGRLPFTESQVKEIQRLSEGVPGKINQMANVLLVKLESGNMGKESAAFPAVHRALLVLLIVVVGLLYLLWQQSENRAERESRIAEAIPVPVEQPVEPLQSDPPAPAQIAEAAAQEAVPAEPAVAELETATEPETEPDPEPEVEAEVTLGPPATEAAEVFAPQPVDVRSASVGEVVAPAPGESVRTALAKPDQLEAPQPTPVEAAAPESTPLQPPEPEPAAEVAAAPAPSQPAIQTPASAAPETVAPPEDEFDNSEWLLGRDPQSYTLQLVTVSSAERARSYVDAQRDPRDFAVYRLRRDGRVLHVVIYGVFATRSEAEAASRSLPASVGDVKPWIRTLGQIQGAIRTMQQ